MLNAEVTNKLAVWRQKAAAGTITQAEMREAIILLRESRRSAAAEPTRASKAKKGPTKSADDLLSELGGLM